MSAASLWVDGRVSPNRTGVGRVIYELTQNLVSNSHLDVRPISHAHSRYGALREIHCPFPISAHPRVEAWELGHFSRQLRREQPSALFCPNNRLIFTRGYRGKKIVMFHDIIPLKYPEFYSLKTSLWFRFCLNYSAKHADLITTTTESNRADILEAFPFLSSDRVRVNPLWLSPALQKVKAEASSPIPKPYFLIVGTLEPRKNHLKIVEAIRAIPRDLLADFSFVFAGSVGWKSNEIVRKLQELKRDFPESVFTFDHVSDGVLSNLYRHAFALLFPSFDEGFGLPLLEAMAFDVPIITSDVRALREVAAESALYVNPHSSESIAAAIVQLAQDSQKQIQLKELGRNRVQSFTLEKHVERFRTLLA